MRGRHKLEDPKLRSWEKNLECFNMRVPAKFFELSEQPFAVLLVVRRADVMRARGEKLHILLHVVWGRNRAELLLPALFRRARITEESTEAGLLLLLANRHERKTKNQTNHKCKTAHNTSREFRLSVAKWRSRTLFGNRSRYHVRVARDVMASNILVNHATFHDKSNAADDRDVVQRISI